MDANKFATKLSNWKDIDKKKYRVAKCRIVTFMNEVSYMDTCGLPSTWDDNLILHVLDKYENIMRITKRDFLIMTY
jgi:hypothetical protein